MEFISEAAWPLILSSAILRVIHPEQFRAALRSLRRLGPALGPADRKVLENWPSVFNALNLIVNRESLLHRDSQSDIRAFDFLYNFGQHRAISFDLASLGIQFAYTPGTAVALAGRLLLHGADNSADGDRGCIAQYVRANVFWHVGHEMPGWMTVTDFFAQF